VSAIKPRSGALTDGASRAGARAMLRAVGLKDEDFAKPLIGIANTWIEIGPCNYHLRELAEHVRAGIKAAGGTPLEFNTVSISDGITMGTEGMRASLVSREVIADSIEVAVRGHMFDAVVAITGCDKTNPGALMALVIDRRREFGLLRFLGASSKQIRKLVLIEAALLGLLANLAGFVLGYLLSLVLIFVINKQSFGWTIRFHWPVAVLLGALSTVYLATLISGLYPAGVAVRLNPLEVIHEE